MLILNKQPRGLFDCDRLHSAYFFQKIDPLSPRQTDVLSKARARSGLRGAKGIEL